VNIHGGVDTGSAIFGIDALDDAGANLPSFNWQSGEDELIGDRMQNPHAVLFTKTYRLLNMGVPSGINELIHTASKYSDQPPTAAIKFYGHSLGKADESYFNAIFDGVDLYSSHTKLIFYYSVYQDTTGKDDVEIQRIDQNDRREMCLKVTRLINTYGTTMDNKAHGANLLHKLLIEGRLKVKKI
jgi:hypothetical protein